MGRIEIEDLMERLDSISEGDGEYMHEVAEKAVQRSAYWYSHPNGPVRAPRHSERLEHGNTGLELEFGANTFLVEEAIRRCVVTLRAAARLSVEGQLPTDEQELRGRMMLAVRSAVCNFEGSEYPAPYNASDGFMHFGAQAIHVQSFVGAIWDETEAYLLTSDSV